MKRTCLFCDTRIHGNWEVCRKHYRYFLDNRHEPWVQALLDMEKTQRKIDKYEVSSIDANFIYNPEPIYQKKLGRPRRVDHDKAIELRELGYSYPDIAKFLNCHVRTVIWIIKTKARYLINNHRKEN